jgi:hypothetical protein
VAGIVALVRCSGFADGFRCHEDGQCVLDGAAGRCEADGLCSFDDAECPSGRRYSEHAGELSDECTNDGCAGRSLPCIGDTRGALVHGGTLLISGRGFGTKDVGAIQFDDFEGDEMEPEANLATVTANRFRHNQAPPVISADATMQRGPSTKNVAAPVGGDNQPLFATEVGEVSRRLFVSLWIRWIENGYIGLFHLQDSNEVIDTNAAFPMVGSLHAFDPGSAGGGEPVDPTSSYRIYTAAAMGVGTDLFLPVNQLLEAAEHWINASVQIDEGAPPDEPGRVIAWLSHPGAQYPIASIDDEELMIKEDANEHLDLLVLLWWVSSPTLTNIHLDDIYVDTAWSRVEIGDAPNYADCHQREIQLPESWADDEVTIRLKQGGLSSLSGSYLFVVDAEGIPSAGFALRD